MSKNAHGGRCRRVFGGILLEIIVAVAGSCFLEWSWCRRIVKSSWRKTLYLSETCMGCKKNLRSRRAWK